MSILFQNTEINGMGLKNRFVRSATWEARASDGGLMTDDLRDFTIDLAKGGLGLVVMGHAYVLPQGKATPAQTALDSDLVLDGLAGIPPLIHRHGGRVAIQIS